MPACGARVRGARAASAAPTRERRGIERGEGGSRPAQSSTGARTLPVVGGSSNRAVQESTMKAPF